MKRIRRLSTLAGALVATVLLAFARLISPQAANADPPRRDFNTFYGGGFAPGYGGYSRYSPYGSGRYAYYPPRAYVYPSVYSGYGSGPYGYGFPGGYAYGAYSYRAYSPYGSAVIGPFGAGNHYGVYGPSAY